MSENTKIVVGILTLLPLISIFFYIGFIFSFITNVEGSGASDITAMKGIFAIAILLIFSLLFSIGLLIYYIIHAVNNKKLDSNERIIWILLFFFFSNIAFMIYWVLKIWQDKDSEVPTTRSEFLDDQI